MILIAWIVSFFLFTHFCASFSNVGNFYPIGFNSFYSVSNYQNDKKNAKLISLISTMYFYFNVLLTTISFIIGVIGILSITIIPYFMSVLTTIFKTGKSKSLLKYIKLSTFSKKSFLNHFKGANFYWLSNDLNKCSKINMISS